MVHRRELSEPELGRLVRDLAARVHRGHRAGRDDPRLSPPLWRMGAYEVLATGELRRWSLSYAEELRPIGA